MATLNPMQQKACEHVEGPLLILAGAGSGKTRVITHRAAYLIDEVGINPWNILAITFTNKAAKEMRERVDNIVGAGAESIWVSTFHSLCVRILRRHAELLGYDTNFNIYDSDDQKSAIKNILKELKIDPKKYPEKMFLAEISKAKERYISPDQYAKNSATDYAKSQVANVYYEYAKRLKRFNAFDFDDLLYKTVELFEKNPDVLDYYQERFKYIMVDEYQDTNGIQFLFVKLLAAKYRNLCVVGDDDQSIYKFRGANITNILNFENVYPDALVVKLEQNYRSYGNILNAANSVIKNNEARKEKALWTDKGDGARITFRQCNDEYMEAEQVIREMERLHREGAPFRTMAVLYRTNAQSRVIGEKMVVRGIPHRVFGSQNFYERKEIKDIMAYLKVVNNEADDTYLRRIINVPRRGIGDASVDRANVFASENEITLIDALHRVEEIDGLARAKEKIGAFVELIDQLKFVNMTCPLTELFDHIVNDTGYTAELKAENTDEATSRLENIDELRNRVVQFEKDFPEATLSDFLEDTALVAETDKLSDDDDFVSLMTLHGAKGLEFPYVFITGLEESIFPSYMSMTSEDPDAMDEERRLAYVGITRAMNKLYMYAARQRMTHGQTRLNDISRFVREVPVELFEDAGDIVRSNKQKAKRDFEDGMDFGFNSVLNPKRQMATKAYGSSNPYSAYGKMKSGGGKPTGVGALSSYGVTKGAPSGGGDLTIDYAVGDKVKHIKFGVGTVTGLTQGGKDYEVTVDFDRVGTKKMFASFARLKKV